MLNNRNSGKYLSKLYLDLRNAGIRDCQSLTESEKTYADIRFPDEGGGKDNERTYVISSLEEGKLIDIRKLPNSKTGDE